MLLWYQIGQTAVPQHHYKAGKESSIAEPILREVLPTLRATSLQNAAQRLAPNKWK